jgi:hypothetical protein
MRKFLKATGRYLQQLPKGLAGLYILFVLGAILPFFWGSGVTIDKDRAGSALRPRKIPEEYQFLYDWIEKSPSGYKTLVFPGKTPFSTTSSKHPAVYGNYYNQSPLLEFSDYFWVNAFGHPGVMSRSLTDNLGKVLGLLNIRNVVIAPESEPMWNVIPNDGRGNIIKAITAQRGLSRQDLSQVAPGTNDGRRRSRAESEKLHLYRNDFALPLIYGAQEGALIVGGLDAILQISMLDANFADRVFFFAGQLQDRNINMLKAVDTIVFAGKDVDDLILASVKQKYKIDLWDYAEFATRGLPTEQRRYDYYKNCEEIEWLRFFSSYWTSRLGDIPESKKGLVQAVGVNLDKPLTVSLDTSEKESYEIWLRVGLTNAEESGEFSVYLDNVLLGYVRTKVQDTLGLKWIKIAKTSLSKGEHTITIHNRGGVTALDQLVVVPAEQIGTLRRKISDIIFDKKSLLLFGRENLAKDSGWYKEQDSSGIESAMPQSHEQLSSLSRVFEIPHGGYYSFAVKTTRLAESTKDTVTASVDGKNVYLDPVKRGEGKGGNPYWIESRPIFLGSGRHEIMIDEEGGLAFDLLAVHNGDRRVEEVFKAEGSELPLSWDMVSSTKYTAELSRSEFVVFNNNYSPAWKGLVNGDQLTSFQANGWANGFLIDNVARKEKLTITLDLQRHTSMGFYISLIFLAILGGFLFFSSKFAGSILSRQSR